MPWPRSAACSGKLCSLRRPGNGLGHARGRKRVDLCDGVMRGTKGVWWNSVGRHRDGWVRVTVFSCRNASGEKEQGEVLRFSTHLL